MSRFYIITKDKKIEATVVSEPTYIKGRGKVIAYNHYDKDHNYVTSEIKYKDVIAIIVDLENGLYKII